MLSVGQELSTLPRNKHAWIPPNLDPPVGAEEIVASLDNHFCSLFQWLCSRDWIQEAFGYDTDFHVEHIGGVCGYSHTFLPVV